MNNETNAQIEQFAEALKLRPILLKAAREELQRRYPKYTDRKCHREMSASFRERTPLIVWWALDKYQRGYFGSDCNDQNLLKLLRELQK